MNRFLSNPAVPGKIRLLAMCLLILFGISPNIWAQDSGEMQKLTLLYKDTLALDFYNLKRETPGNQPLVVLVHGGGFSGGKRDGVGEEKFCRDMAELGYAVASLSYRLTRKGESFGCDCPSQAKINTFVAASEDLTGALEFLLARDDLIFDREKVVLVGSSAGAETVLNTAFMSAHHSFRHLNPPKIAGLVSFAGAVLQSSYINERNAVPTLLFHGEKDELVPFATAAHHYCSEEDPGYLVLDGSETIADRLETLGVPYVLAFDPDGTHDWANTAYEKVELVHHFLKDVVEAGHFEQKRIRIWKTGEE